MNNKPLVSVVMPVYNASEYILESVKSILNQTYNTLEIIIVDDGCTDSSIDKIKSLQDSRISILNNPSNMGLAASLNLAIKHSSGSYIARMDADDISTPLRIEKQIGMLERNADISVLGTGLQYFNESSFKNYFPEHHDDCKSKLLFNVCFGHPSVIFRKTVFDRPENLYNPELRQYSEDYDLYTRLVDQYQFANLQEPYLKYRTFKPSVKSEAEEKRRSNSRLIRNRVLKAMDIIPSVNEQELHRLASNLSTNLDHKTLMDIAAWFRYLHEKNLSISYFNHEALRFVLAEHFFLLAYHNPHLRISLKEMARNLSFFQGYSISTNHLLKYILKKALNIHR